MEQLQELLKPLYQTGDLLGFSVCNEKGKVLHNESFLSDEYAWKATLPFVSVTDKLERAKRDVLRLTVELDKYILIYGQLDIGHALFTLSKDCDLDSVAELLS